MKWRDRSSRLADELVRLRGLTPHELLGVPEDAGPEQIKHAYRQLAKVYHPDRADPFMRRHNEAVIKLINAAYDRLAGGLEGAQ